MHVLTKLAASAMVNSTLLSKYGHFWLQKSNMVMVKSLVSRKPVGDVTVTSSIFFYSLWVRQLDTAQPVTFAAS